MNSDLLDTRKINLPKTVSPVFPCLCLRQHFNYILNFNVVKSFVSWILRRKMRLKHVQVFSFCTSKSYLRTIFSNLRFKQEFEFCLGCTKIFKILQTS